MSVIPATQMRRARTVARRYIWWEPPAKTLANLPRFLAHAMNLATWEDHVWLETHFSRAQLRQALQRAPAGTFTARSWNFWHIRLGARSIPRLPQKQIPA
jgi:hypothetical protein